MWLELPPQGKLPVVFCTFWFPVLTALKCAVTNTVEKKTAQECVLTQNFNCAFIMLKNNFNSISWQLFRVGFGIAFGFVLLAGKEPSM